MKRMQLTYVKGKTVEYTFDNYLIFIGSNNEFKQQLQVAIKRFGDGRSYSEVEEDFFGEEGIEFLIDEKKIDVKKTIVKVIETKEDIINEFKIERGNILSELILRECNVVNVIQQVEVINDELLRLENLIQSNTSKLFPNFSFELSSMQLQNLIQKYSVLNYVRNERSLPLYAMDTTELMRSYLNLLNAYLGKNDKQILIVLIYPEHYLSEPLLSKTIREFIQLSECYEHIHLIIFHQSQNAKYVEYDINHTVVCGEFPQQLPEYSYFKQSIERHYPLPLTLSNEELVSTFYRIGRYLGVKEDENSIFNDKTMIILSVINKLLDY